MANIKKGLIFKDNDDIWLGLFENGSIKAFNPISDFDGYYDDLPETKFCIVDIKLSENDNIEISDKAWVEMGKIDEGKDPNNDENFNPKRISFMLSEVGFPSKEADDIFTTIIYSGAEKEC